MSEMRLKVSEMRRLAVLLPLLLAATALPVMRPAPAPRVGHWTLEAAGARKAPSDFSLVGVSSPRAPDGPIQIRVSRDGKRWGRWTEIEFEREVGPDLDSHERGAHTSMPVWTGTNRYVEVRGAPKGAEVHTIDPGPDPVQPASSAMASPAKPGIITRAQWGADESIRKGKNDIAQELKFAVIHHTATADSYGKSESDDIVRSIYAYHVKTNGWDDIGYNFLVDRYGQVFEGRHGGVTKNVVGAHSQGFNTSSTGISIIGNFANSKPPEVAMSALKRITSWRLDQGTVDPEASVTYVSNGSNKYPKGQKVTLKRVIGHRDVGTTACPGNPLQNSLPWLRSAARKDGLPKVFDAKVTRLAVTPNADGVADSLKLTAKFSSSMNWRATVANSAGSTIYSLSGSGLSVSINWYGKDSGGRVVPHGPYVFKITGSGAVGSLRTYNVPFSVYKWPNGTFMYTQSKVTYVLHKGKLRHPSHWQSRSTRYQSDEYVSVPDAITKYYPKSTWLGFREGSMVSYDGKVYLISEGKKRPTTKAVLAAKGFDTSGIIATTATALEPHETGSSFTSSSRIPNGAAVRASTGTEGWMIGGVARHFFNQKVRNSYLIRDAEFAEPADELLAAGAFEDPIGFRDGTLIRVADQTIYFVSDGKRRPFSSSSVFTRMGFKKDNIVSVTPAELAVHDEGKPL